MSTGASVEARYRAHLEQHGFTADAAQLAAVARLDRLASELWRFRVTRESWLGRVIKRPEPPRGVWMHGGVGRGKSFLMDCFYSAVRVKRKTRLHFHEFMRGVHRELRDLRGQADPLDAVAERVARRYRLVCFDEFHVSDIADAMILERLFRGLIRHGVVFVVTSNYAPAGLYPGGLHRERILPAIELLERSLDVITVDAGIDYRKLGLDNLQTYHWPLGPQADRALELAFESLAEAGDDDPELEIEHRTFRARRRAGSIVWFDFATLCGGPRAQTDYLELASLFQTIVLSDVPQMTPAMASEARRFLWLIDVLYDQRVKLIMSAQCPPESLYPQGQMAHEFVRTASRLAEMQTREYLAQPRRGVAERIA